MKRSKGFTLIELLAVIVVLGIIMMIAVTSVSGVLEKSRKDAFVATARAYISAVRLQASQNTAVNESGATVGLPACGSNVTIPLSTNMVEKGGVTSPYNKSYRIKSGSVTTDYSYVRITGGTADSNGICTYTYAIYLTDGDNKIAGPSNAPIAEKDLTSASVTK